MEGFLAKELPFVHISDTELRIEDVWENGEWKFNGIYSILNPEIKQSILNYNPTSQQGAKAGIFWSASSSRVYSASSGYRWL
ncbi:hypothetical protein PIB30_113955, partial [Stylosanthes scabra]|nr:hypothetical protein [Stylosanthes scabra]